MAYIHYGSPQFSLERFDQPRNTRGWNKPQGGLWASDEAAKYGWKDWCDAEHFRECRDENAFLFELAPSAKVLCLDSTDAVRKLPLQENEYSGEHHKAVDFEKLVRDGVDAIDFKISADPRLYWSMYGWDCDCILVLNPSVIIPKKVVGK